MHCCFFSSRECPKSFGRIVIPKFRFQDWFKGKHTIDRISGLQHCLAIMKRNVFS